MMKKKVVRLYTSLHYVIDVCYIHYPSFISPFIITTRKKRALFIYKRKGFRYNIIVAYLTIRLLLSLTYSLICTIVMMAVSLLLLFYIWIMMRTTKLCACCLYVLTVEYVAPDRVLSIYLSIYLLLVYRLKGRDKCLCRLADKYYHSYFLSIRLFFSLSFAVLPIEQRLRNKTCVRRLYYQQCMLLSSKTLSAISAVCRILCFILFFPSIQINRVSTHCSMQPTVKMIIFGFMMILLSRNKTHLFVAKTCTYTQLNALVQFLSFSFSSLSK
jgi:hypothetical protein